MTPKKRSSRGSLERAIGEGYVLEEGGLLSPTRRLRERQRVQRLLDYWNVMENSQWEISKRPEDESSDDPAADFLCVDEATGQTALIDVTAPHLTESFGTKAAQGAEEISFDLAEVRRNIARLLKHKNRQLERTADRRCVLFVWEGSTLDPFYDFWAGVIRKSSLNRYPNIDEVYVAPDDTSASVTRVLPA